MSEISRRLTSSRRFVFVKRRLPPDVVEAVRALDEPALGFVEESMRLYPNRELGAQAIGFEGTDGKGLAGVEQGWDALLAGTEGKALVVRDALGREMTGAPRVLKPSVPGQGLMLTIDATLQYIAEHCPEVLVPAENETCGATDSTFYVENGYAMPLDRRTLLVNQSVPPPPEDP